MSKVITSIEINAPLEKVYNFSKEIEAFPEFMADIKEITVLSNEKTEKGSKYKSHWVGYIKDFNLSVKWNEVDVWDDTEHICYFEMPEGEGDYEIYKGIWKFSPKDENTTFVEMEIEVEYNVPMIGALIKKLIAKLVKQNADGMLEAIKGQVE
ncbi:MAG: SRPBCC family protein [Abditibacteriota bacterium]|nr:SRPBCC family protein [Abditibacteriota bacterium]